MLHWFVDFVLHLDVHLVQLLAQYGAWIYGILFLIIFSETGLVLTPFLPGDSLLFAVGALAAIDSSGTLTGTGASLLLALAAILGNTVNFAVGYRLGRPAFDGRYRFVRVEYLKRTEAYFARYGGATVFVSRFMPIVRTFAPFVAGVGRMPFTRFQAWNIAGGVSWVFLLVWGGFFFGNIPVIRNHFGFVTLLIILVSLLPLVGLLRRNAAA